MELSEHRLGELFSGPGGLAWGAHLASERVESPKIVHGWATDYDEDTCATYRKNIPGTEKESVIHADVRTLDTGALGDIEGLAFGFPCNDFSIVGEHKGLSGEYGPLYQYGVNVLASHQPLWFLAENVGGLRGANGGEAFKAILQALERPTEEEGKHGYRITPHLYKFEQYGVPQARHRILIVGIREDLDVEFKVPDPAQYAGWDVSARKAIEDPAIEDGAANHEFTRQSEQVVKRLKCILPGQNAFNADLPPELRLNVKGARLSQIYKRLLPDKPAYTITGSGGGGTHVYHWKDPRALTNRERARLQTFPDEFEFLGSKESVRKQVGMAVPPRGAAAVFEAILKSFAKIDYDSIEHNIPTPERMPDAPKEIAQVLPEEVYL